MTNKSLLRSKKFIYITFCISNIVINIDQGVLPAATNEMMIDLDLSEVEFGCLGSLMYIGLIIGSTIAGHIYQQFPCKKIVIFNLICIGACLSVFTYSGNIYIFGFSRILTGFFQVFLVIFFPVWVDFFGGKNKTLWLTILQLGVPLGTFFGYILTVMSMALLNWKWGFFLQIISMAPSLILFILFDEEDLNIQMVKNRLLSDMSENMTENFQVNEKKASDIEIEIIELAQTSKISQKSLESPEIQKILYPNYLQTLKVVMSSKIYICSILAISSLLFIVTGMQFWGTDYYRNVMHQERDIVFLTYSIVSISGPTLGVLFGGYYVHRKGGYTSQNALKICLQLSFFAAFFACPFPFIPIFPVSVVMMWFLLFFGGSLMPTLTGVMISSVPREYRAFGNSTAQFFLNLLGFLPSPFIYGLICKMTGGRSSPWGMASLMVWSIFGLGNIFMAFALDKRKRQTDKKENFESETGKEKLSSISESSESLNEKKKKTNEITDTNENVEFIKTNKEDSKYILKKKSSLIQISYINSIIVPLSIPKVKFSKKKKEKSLSISYEEAREKLNNRRILTSQTFIETNKMENLTKTFRLRNNSESINHEPEILDVRGTEKF